MADIEPPNSYNPTSITNLRQQIVSRGGVQYASRYVVDFVSPYGTFTTYPLELNMPQRALATFEVGQPTSLWGTKRSIPLQHEYDNITMSFIIYQDWAEKDFFDKWMNKIINSEKYSEERTDEYEYSYPYFSYTGKIYISTLSGNSQLDNPIFTSKILLDEAFPISLLPISLSAENSGYTTFVASFAFRKYYNLKNEE